MSVRTAKSGKSAAQQKPVRVRGAAGGWIVFKSATSSKSKTRKHGRKPGWEHSARGARFK